MDNISKQSNIESEEDWQTAKESDDSLAHRSVNNAPPAVQIGRLPPLPHAPTLTSPLYSPKVRNTQYPYYTSLTHYSSARGSFGHEIDDTINASLVTAEEELLLSEESPYHTADNSLVTATISDLRDERVLASMNTLEISHLVFEAALSPNTSFITWKAPIDASLEYNSNSPHSISSTFPTPLLLPRVSPTPLLQPRVSVDPAGSDSIGFRNFHPVYNTPTTSLRPQFPMDETSIAGVPYREISPDSILLLDPSKNQVSPYSRTSFHCSQLKYLSFFNIITSIVIIVIIVSQPYHSHIISIVISHSNIIVIS